MKKRSNNALKRHSDMVVLLSVMIWFSAELALSTDAGCKEQPANPGSL
jgi:hypothetical protein